MNLSRFAVRAPFPILRVTPDGVVEWANRSARPLLEAWGSAVGASLPPSDAARIALVSARGTDTELDQQIGERAWSMLLCPDANGVIVYAHDRSRHAEAEKRLMVADRAPALSPLPVIQITASGQLHWANAASSELLTFWGITKGEQVPSDWQDIIKKVAQTGTPHRRALPLPGGACELIFQRDVKGGMVYGFGQMCPTEAPSAAKQSQNFVANMGHELRTPLNAVIGYAELVQDELADRNHSDLLPDIGKIVESARTLRSLIDDMVDLAKLQAGKISLRNTQFYVTDLVDDLLVQTSTLAEINQNELLASVDLDHEEMSADAQRLRKVLSEVLDNAAKFTENGQIEVTVNNAVSGDGTELVRIRVRDTGIGIPPEQLGRLFEAYEQGDGSASRKFSGSGLGLAIAHLLCQKMGGDISVHSEVGKGSTFTVTLPRQGVESS